MEIYDMEDMVECRKWSHEGIEEWRIGGMEDWRNGGIEV